MTVGICPLPWVKPRQKYMLVLAKKDDDVVHIALVRDWRSQGEGAALCGEPVSWAMCIDEQIAGEIACLVCVTKVEK